MAKKRRKSVTCKNCQYQFDGIDNYCPNCGQENHSHHAPFKHIFIELIESLTHFDTKFFATVKALFLKPGLLTKDYIEDKRARYVPPVRLYIFVSFVFFFSLSLFSGEKEYALSHSNAIISTDSVVHADINIMGETGHIGDSLILHIGNRQSITDNEIDSIVTAQIPSAGWLETLAMRQATKQHLGIITQEEIQHALVKNLGIALFFLMPLFAFLLKLLYLRSKRLYIEHLIFSVHFHSFFFALLIITSIPFKLTGVEDWMVLSLAIILIYGILALRRVYGNVWWKTIVKGALLTALYTVCVFITLLITGLVSLAIL